MIIKCPSCKTEIKVDEVLAAPIIERGILAREKGIREEERRNAKLRAEDDQEALRQHNETLQQQMIEQQKAQEKKNAERDALWEARLKAAAETAESKISIKLTEREHLIEGLKTQIATLQQKVEQGSQQLQGEAQEIQLEEMLSKKFPSDKVVPVPKGVHGGDITQSVVAPTGAACGTILWESKRTRTWSDGWLSKLSGDRQAAKADIAVIVSAALPKDTSGFSLQGGIWVTSPALAYPLACVLRQSLIDLAKLKLSLDGHESKAEVLYKYFTSSAFRLRMEAFAEAFSAMKVDLDKERKAITKQWSKREEQIDKATASLMTLYGELQGIAGNSMKELVGADLQSLE